MEGRVREVVLVLALVNRWTSDVGKWAGAWQVEHPQCVQAGALGTQQR